MSTDLPPSPPHGHFAAVNGIQMYYELYGSGEPLILLHGTPSTSSSWQMFIPHYAQRYQVIVPDLRGYGRSTNPQDDWTHRQLAFDVFALLDELGVVQCKAIGHSSGAITLLHLATQQPGRMTAMVLAGAAPYVTKESRTLVKEWADQSHTWNWEDLRLEHVYGDSQIQGIIRGLKDYANRHDDVAFTPPALAAIRTKTLIVHGDRDEHFPVRLAFEMYDAIPDAVLWVMPNAGHGAIFGTQFQAFIQTSHAFLSDTEVAKGK